MKKIQTFLASLILVLIVSCSAEENVKEQNHSTVATAKNWFENNKNSYNDPILKYIKELQWQNSIISEGGKGEVIEIPLILVDKVRITNSETNQMNGYLRLVLKKDVNNKYIPSYVQIYTNNQEFSNLDSSFNYYSIGENFNGFVNVYNLREQATISTKFVNGLKVKSNITAKNDEEAICTYFGWWYEDGHFEAISTLGCTIGGGGAEGSGNGGYGGTAPGADTGAVNSSSDSENSPPSCKSFNFTIKNGSIWQEALVKNINFNIVLITSTGYQITQMINYPQAVYFGVPSNLIVGNTDIDSGLAATLSAKALKQSMDDVVNKFGGAQQGS